MTIIVRCEMCGKLHPPYKVYADSRCQLPGHKSLGHTQGSPCCKAIQARIDIGLAHDAAKAFAEWRSKDREFSRAQTRDKITDDMGWMRARNDSVRAWDACPDQPRKAAPKAQEKP